jgi:glutathione reductase (NADPH)
VFTKPELASVGMTEAEASEKIKVVSVYTSEFRAMKHTLSGNTQRAFMKLVVDEQTDIVLGCHMVGEGASEIIQGLGIALQAGATKDHFDRTFGIHPTAAEEFVTMRTPRPKS